MTDRSGKYSEKDQRLEAAQGSKRRLMPFVGLLLLVAIAIALGFPLIRSLIASVRAMLGTE